MLDLSALSTTDVLRTYAAVMRELRRRGAVRSANNPVSDIAEAICAKALQLQLCPKSEAGCDAIGLDGIRYQIKSRRITTDNPSTRLGVFRELDAGQFDFLLALYFDEEFALTAAYRVPHEVVSKYAVWSKAQNGRILHAKNALLKDHRCENITGLLSRAELQLGPTPGTT